MSEKLLITGTVNPDTFVIEGEKFTTLQELTELKERIAKSLITLQAASLLIDEWTTVPSHQMIVAGKLQAVLLDALWEAVDLPRDDAGTERLLAGGQEFIDTMPDDKPTLGEFVDLFRNYIREALDVSPQVEEFGGGAGGAGAAGPGRPGSERPPGSSTVGAGPSTAPEATSQAARRED